MPSGDHCHVHSEPLVNPMGCRLGDPQGSDRGWTADIEVAGSDLPDAVVEAAKAKSNDGDGTFFRIRLTFNSKGKITGAALRRFSDAYRRRVGG